MTKRVSITLNDAQYEILRHYAGAMGMTDAYALRMAALRDLLDWYAKVMSRNERVIDSPGSIAAPSEESWGDFADVGKA